MKPSKRLILLVTIAMIAFAMVDNVRGLFVPSFKTTYGFSNTLIGWVMLLNSLAYAVASFFAGRLILKFNQKKILMLGTLISAVGILTIATGASKISFYIAIILMNVGIAFSGLAINTTIPKLNVKNHAVLMNFVHFLYGVGATFTQKSAGLLLKSGLHFKTIYLLILIIYVVVFLVAGMTKLPEEHAHENQNTSFTNGQKKLVAIISIALGLYAVAEIQTGNWLVDYGVNTFNMTENAVATFTASFFFIFSIGRLLGGFAVEKIGYMKSVFTCVFIAGTLYAIGLFLGLKGLWVIAISGVFFSITYPTVILSLQHYFKATTTKAAGLVVTISSAINMIFGLIIGRLADLVGINLAMYVLPISLFVSGCLFWYVYKNGEHLAKEA